MFELHVCVKTAGGGVVDPSTSSTKCLDSPPSTSEARASGSGPVASSIPTSAALGRAGSPATARVLEGHRSRDGGGSPRAALRHLASKAGTCRPGDSTATQFGARADGAAGAEAIEHTGQYGRGAFEAAARRTVPCCSAAWRCMTVDRNPGRRCQPGDGRGSLPPPQASRRE